MRKFRTLSIRALSVAAAAASLALLPAQAVHAKTVPATSVAAAAPAKYVQMSNASAPDPDLEIFGSRYYVYATSGSDGVLPVFESDTASIRGGFRQAGTILARAPKGFTGLWAPHVIHAGGWYIAFFTAARQGGDHAVYWVYSKYQDRGFSQAPAEIAAAAAPLAGLGGDRPDHLRGRFYGKLYLVWRRGHYTAGFPYGTFQIKARQITVATVSGKPRITLAAGMRAARQLAQATGNAPVMEAPSLLYRNGRLRLWSVSLRAARSTTTRSRTAPTCGRRGLSITGTFRERRTVLGLPARAGAPGRAARR